MTKNYIEFRVYLKDDIILDMDDISYAAGKIQDALIDALDPEGMAPDYFTQDVTYEVTIGENK